MIGINRHDLLGAQPVFLLEITWNSRVFLFSTYPIDILTDEGKSIHFSGGLADPQLRESINDLNRSPQTNTLSLELIFPVNLVQEFFEFGRLLDIATGELSMVTERQGSILQTYEKRMRIFSGNVIQPIIGDPDQPKGYCALTIERNPNNSPHTIIQPSGIFQGNGSIVSSKTINDFSDGLAYPIVFGNPHQYVPKNGFTTYGYYRSYPTPGFIIYREQTSAFGSEYDKFWLCIAGHPVNATTVLVRDYQNNIKLNVTVKNIVTSQGVEISYVELQYAQYSGGAPVIVDGIVNPWMIEQAAIPGAQTDDPKYYICWDNGGGLINSNGDGFLSGAGDIILYFLQLTNIDIDFQAWNNVSTFLNAYEFGGYVDDPKATAYKFLQDNIFPFVPVQSTNSPKGLKPVIPLLYFQQYPRPIINIDMGIGFYLNSPIEYASEPDDIENRILLEYAWCLFRENTPAGLLIDGNLTIDETSESQTNNELAQLSHSRYGDRYSEVQANYIYDYNTAIKVLMYRLRVKALPKMKIEIQANSLFGWLQLGDILSINSDELYIENFRGMIIEKSYNDSSWMFTIELENSVILQQRI